MECFVFSFEFLVISVGMQVVILDIVVIKYIQLCSGVVDVVICGI